MVWVTNKSVLLIAGLFAVAGSLHFLIPNAYVRIVPQWLPAPRALIYLSGVGEILGAIGLLIPATCRAAAWGLIALLIAVFPANIQMLLNARRAHASGLLQILLWLRLPLQPLLIYWIAGEVLR